MERGDLDVDFFSGTCSDADDLVALGDAIAAAHDVADGEDSSDGTTTAAAADCGWY